MSKSRGATRSLVAVVTMAAGLVWLGVPAASAAACTNNWTAGSGGGSWTTAGNWSLGTVPTASDVVCINNVSAATPVTIGAPATTGELQLTSAALQVNKSLTVTNGSGKSGNVSVDSTSTLVIDPTATATLTVTGTVTNAGTLDGGTAGLGTGTSTMLMATLTNTGTLAVGGTTATFVVQEQAGGTGVSSSGTVTTAAGTTLQLGNCCTNITVAFTAGTVTNSGTLELHQSGDSMAVNGGTFSGNPPLIPGSTTLTFSGAAVSGIFEMNGGMSTLGGIIPSGATVKVDGGGGGGTVINLQNLTTNNGTINLNTNTGSGKLSTAGTFTNSAGATIAMSGTSGQFAIEAATFANAGILSDSTPSASGKLQYGVGGCGGPGGGSFTDTGTISVAAGAEFDTCASNNFTLTGGTITDNGTFTFEGGTSTYTLTSGTITGTPTVNGGTVAFPSGAGGSGPTGTISPGNGVAFTGDVPSTMTIDLVGAGGGLGPTISMSAGASNFGTIHLDEQTNGSIINDAGAFTNTATGTIRETNAGGGNPISELAFTSFTNNGTILANAATATQLSFGGFNCGSGTTSDTMVNNATLNVGSGDTFLVSPGDSFTNNVGGTITQNGTFTFCGGAGSVWTLSGGTASPGVLTVPNANSGTISFGVGSSFSGTVNVSGWTAPFLGTIPSSTTVSVTGAATLSAGSGTANSGTISLAGGGATLGGGGSFSNSGTITSSGGTNHISTTAWTNNPAGTVTVASGELNLDTSPTNLAAGTLTNGTWSVTGGTKLCFLAGIATDAATISLSGAGAKFDQSACGGVGNSLSGLTSISAGGSLSLLSGATLTTTGALSNGGSITLGSSDTLTTGTTYTQTAGGTLSTTISGTTPGTTFGQLVSTGATATAGTLNATTSSFTPSSSQNFQVVAAASESGTFSTVNSFGGFTYSATYNASGGSAGVVLNGAASTGGGTTGPTGPPAVTSLSPVSGPQTGGTLVTITGTNLQNPTSVTFGNVSATNVQGVNPSKVLALAPPGTGVVDVTVTTSLGSSPTNPGDAYSYISSVIVTKVSPQSGPEIGGTAVTLTGTGFTGATAVVFGAFAATNFTVNSDTSITVTSPVGQGLVDIQVTTPKGTSPMASADQYNYSPLLFTSNKALGDSLGEVPAAWSTLLPLPGKGNDAGLPQPLIFGGVYFYINYTAGEHVYLSSDAAGTTPFCVQGSWTLNLAGTSVSKTQNGSSASGTDCTGSPFDLASLNLPTGTYGGEMELTAPSSGTSFGSTDLYVSVQPGSSEPYGFSEVPGVGENQMIVGGSATIALISHTPTAVAETISQAGHFATGVHNQYQYDPSGIQVTSASAPSNWTIMGSQNQPAVGEGGFIESGSTPIGPGSTVATLNVSCLQNGSWPISFLGTYWGAVGLPGSSLSASNYTYSVSGLMTVTCGTGQQVFPGVYYGGSCQNPPNSNSCTSVNINPATGEVDFTFENPIVVIKNGSATQEGCANGLGGPFSQSDTTLRLFDRSGNTIAPTKLVAGTAGGCGVDAVFPPMAAGPYGFYLTGETFPQGGGVDVPPWIDWTDFVKQVDTMPNVPVVPTTHIWTTSNLGDKDGVSVVAFSFPSYVTSEPLIATSVLPGGSKLIAATDDPTNGWVLLVGIPLGVGQSVEIPISVSVPVDAFFGSNPAFSNAGSLSVIATTIGSISEAQLASVPTDSASDAASFVSALTNSDLSSNLQYLNTLSSSEEAGYSSGLGASSLELLAIVRGAQIYQLLQHYFASNKLSEGSQAKSAKSSSPHDIASKTGTASDIWGIIKAIYCGKDLIGASESAALDQLTSLLGVLGDTGPAATGSGYLGAILFASDVTTGGIVYYAENSTSIIDTYTQLRDQYAQQTGLDPEASWSNFEQLAELKLDSYEGYGSPLTGYLDNLYGLSSFDSTPSKDLSPTQIQVAMDMLELGYQQRLQQSGKQTDPNMNSWFEKQLKDQLGSQLNIDTIRRLVQAPGFCDSAGPAKSVDPNFISVSPAGTGNGGWITSPTALHYTIEFQNEPTATANAVNVRVSTQLDPSLDPSTIQDGPSSTGTDQISYDPTSKTLTWLLPNIDLPPDSSPPNGEGYVSFTAATKSGLSNGTTISQQANVYFDYNPPVTTNTATLSVDSVVPSVSTPTVSPAPSLSGSTSIEAPGNVTLNWSGRSAAGVDHYVVYVQTNGGPLNAIDTTSSTAMQFTLVAGNSYGFAVQAFDVAGLRSSMPTSPQLSFVVSTANSGSGSNTSSILVPGSKTLSSGAIGTVSPATSVTVQNLGATSISMQSATLSGANAADFKATNDSCSGISLAAGSSCSVAVAYTPSTASAEVATLSFADSGPSSPQTVALTGLLTSTSGGEGSGSASGYRLIGADGGVFTFGGASMNGSLSGIGVTATNVVGSAGTPDGTGYWMVDSTGNVSAFGDAGFFGSLAGTALARPIVGMAATPSGKGYWLVASDGGIFSFGDASFFGSTGGIPLNKPVVGMASTSDAKGYWLVASDGGIFSFGGAKFYGSAGAIALSRPVVGMQAMSSSAQGHFRHGPPKKPGAAKPSSPKHH